MQTTLSISRPQSDEHVPYYSRYVDRVPGDDALLAMRRQIQDTLGLLGRTPEPVSQRRYAPGKWSVRQVVGHLCDVERVMSYRALRIARGDTTPLPGFDENSFAEAGGSDARTLADLAAEFGAVRAASVALFQALAENALVRRGTANDATITPRALAWIIAGHELHHVGLLRERYGLQ